MTQVVWLTEGSLGSVDPALQRLPDAPAIFIFDDDYWRARPTSFKRLFFIYESVVETFATHAGSGEIHRGDLVREIIDFCRKHGAQEVHVTRSPSPAYRLWVDQLRRTLDVVEYAPEEFVSWSGRAPRRFIDLWNKALPQALPQAALPAEEED